MEKSNTKEKIANNISIILIGIIITRIISFIGTSLIIRMLEPHNYGLLNISFAMPYIFTLISDMGITSAIIRFCARYKHNNEIKKLKIAIKVAILSSLTISSVNTIFLIIMSYKLSLLLFNTTYYEFLLQVAALGVFSNILYNVTIGILNGLEKMKNVSISMILQALIRSVLSPILIVYYGLLGAMFGFIIAPLIVGSSNLCIILYKNIKIDSTPDISKFSLLKEMIIFGAPILISISIEPLTFQIYNLLLIQYATILEIGNFNVVLVFSSIIAILINPFDTSLYPAFSKEKISKINLSIYNEIYNTFMRHMSILITPIIGIVPIFSPLIVLFIFGNSYKLAISYLSYFMLYYVSISFGKTVLHSFLKGQGYSVISAMISILSVFLSIIITLVLIKYIGIIIVYISLSISSLLMTYIGHNWIEKKFNLSIDIKTIVKINLVVFIDYILILLINEYLKFNIYLKYIIDFLVFIMFYLIMLIKYEIINEKDLYELNNLYGKIILIKQIISIFIKIELFIYRKINKKVDKL